MNTVHNSKKAGRLFSTVARSKNKLLSEVKQIFFTGSFKDTSTRDLIVITFKSSSEKNGHKELGKRVAVFTYTHNKKLEPEQVKVDPFHECQKASLRHRENG